MFHHLNRLSSYSTGNPELIRDSIHVWARKWIFSTTQAIRVLKSSTLCSSRKSSLSSSKTTSGKSVALWSTLWTHLSGAAMVKKYFFELCGITYSRPPRLVLWKFQLKFGNVVKLLVKLNWSIFFFELCGITYSRPPDLSYGNFN